MVKMGCPLLAKVRLNLRLQHNDWRTSSGTLSSSFSRISLYRPPRSAYGCAAWPVFAAIRMMFQIESFLNITLKASWTTKGWVRFLHTVPLLRPRLRKRRRRRGRWRLMWWRSKGPSRNTERSRVCLRHEAARNRNPCERSARVPRYRFLCSATGVVSFFLVFVCSLSLRLLQARSAVSHFCHGHCISCV